MFHKIVNGSNRIYLNEAANDLWIRELIFPGLRNGYFVEAGAADGKAGSSCFLLEKQFGWTGICIEPNPIFYRALLRNRPASLHYNVCLADRSGSREFAMGGSVSPYLGGLVSALEEKAGGAEVLAKALRAQLPASRLDELLRAANAPRMIEYGAFDIEGSEFEALQSFPFDEYTFLALSFETDEAISDRLSHLLRANGYRESKNPFNTDQPWETYWLHESFRPGSAAAQ